MSFLSDSDQTFSKLKQEHLYWAVLTDDEYQTEDLSLEAKERFFATGVAHVDRVLGLIGKHFSPICFERALDFGCGVGRVAIPLANHFSEVVGMDISDVLLDEAKANAGDREIVFVQSDDTLSAAEGVFDFVHSFIVLQHIPKRRVKRLMEQLIDRIGPGGVAALHVVFDRRASFFRKALHAMRKHCRPIDFLVKLLRKRPLSEPFLQMNHTKLKGLFRLMADKGIRSFHSEIEDHGGHLGLFLFFQKETLPPQ